jgi:hypothetical protein
MLGTYVRHVCVTNSLGRLRMIRGMEGGKQSDVAVADGEPLLIDTDVVEQSVGVPHLGGADRDPKDAPTGLQPGVLRQRSLAERTAINTVVQGSAADLIKLAMINIHRRLRAERLASRMLLQIHDELIFESPPDEINRLVALIKQEMSGVLPLAVPLKVDVKTGLNWAECEPWN